MRLRASLWSLLILLVAGSAWANPFIVCDAYIAGQVDYFKVTVDAAAPAQSPVYQVPATTNYILHFDVGGVSIASHAIKVQACKAATMWGPEACSAQTNFTFARPADPVAPPPPSAIGLASQ